MPHTSARWRLAAAAFALSAGLTAFMAPAQAQTPLPATHAFGDSVAILTATSELQLLNGPGIKPTATVAKPGTAPWVGKKSAGRPLASRLFYAFDLSGIPADSITEVTLNHFQIWSPNSTCYLDSYGPPVNAVTTAAPTSSQQWPGPAVTSAAVASGFALGNSSACYPYDNQRWNVTDIVRAAALNSSTVHVGLASADEQDPAGYREYGTAQVNHPVLRVYFRPHPDQPSNLRINPVPNSGQSPLITRDRQPMILANVTTPGGCPNTTGGPFCVGARYEVTTPDGTVIASGLNDDLTQANGAGSFFQQVGPLTEGVDYLVKVWGVNRFSGLESLEPATITIRYDAPPAAPTVTFPSDVWRDGQPMTMTVTTDDSDAKQVCWRVFGDVAVTGCADITPGVATPITIRSSAPVGVFQGSVWIVDAMGSSGAQTTFVRSVIW